MQFKGKKTSRKNEVKAKDVPIEDPQPGDLVIPILGVTGAGKSTFINALLGRDAATVGHDLRSQTETVHHYILSLPRGRVVILDTPGFDDMDMEDREILSRIATWLNQSYGAQMRLAGVIYLHEIIQPRMSDMIQKNLDLFHKLCGPDVNKNIVFATTKWSDAPPEAGKRREDQLRDLHWKARLSAGSKMYRFEDTHSSAQRIVDSLLIISGDTEPSVQQGETQPRHSSHFREIHTIEQETPFAAPPDKGFNWTNGAFSKWFMTKGRNTMSGMRKIDTVANRLQKEKRKEDKFLGDAQYDIIIPIMGPTGAGKSTFINAIIGKDIAKVGHDLRPETSHLQHFVLPCPNNETRRIIIIDTPGFDDTYVADTEILKGIAAWLIRSYPANMKIAGVIYLHEISQTRLLGTAHKTLDIFNKLVGTVPMKNIYLTTTKWSEVPPEVGMRRETQLGTQHWKDILELGAELHRFIGSQASAWNIIQRILDGVGRS